MRTCSKCGSQIDQFSSYCPYCGNLIAFNDDLKIDFDLSEKWYCVYGSKRIGPLSEDDVKQAVKLKYIHRATLVWCEGMKDWTPAGKTRLSKFTGEYMEPAPSAPPDLPWKKEEAEERERHAVTNLGAWLIIAVPLIVYLVLKSIPSVNTHNYFIAFMVIISMWAFVLLDQVVLIGGGYRPKGMFLWGLFFPAVYLYKRSQMIRTAQFPFLIVLVAVILAFIFILFYVTFKVGGANGVSAIQQVIE